ncbi:MAG: UvrD-helicase domain-containing protein [Humidesulfovibrio sp.]|nr:UvrD-helicase domain-containing protein [Humidesulfovibrio sp.]
MPSFAADLHIHSRFSRATSKGLTVRNLAAWAEVKGIGVLGTGDLTHPGWLAEIERELEEDGSGLLRLRDPASLDGQIPGLPLKLSGGARFMLQGEISSIYKRGGKVRKVHNLVYMPTLEAAKSLNAKLSQVGNLASDGRPILGLDSRNLLEMVLETHPEAFLAPAHIWTPWFSLFGSMSGFDTVEECYGDLSPHIFAMETGLSSDPGMNWTLSALDRYRMISNSDAHSGEKLGREANLFRGEASFSGIRNALRAHLTGAAGDCQFLGTVEFFPEEGKYHLDGHRKCNWSMVPGETLAHKGLCPVCGKPATLGVLHRVLALADRPEPVQPQNQPGYDSLIPLREVLSEVLDVGAGSKAVTAEYYRLLGRLGPELFILREAPLADIGRASTVLAEAVERMRAGKVLRSSGYDGEYGVITVFTPEERAEMRRGRLLAGMPARRGRRPVEHSAASEPEGEPGADPDPAPQGLNPAQEAAVSAGLGPASPPGPVLVLAGPGTGKTHTLLARVLRLLEAGVPPQSLAVVTFTRRAANELHERLEARLGLEATLPVADTLHALALDLWTARKGQPPVLLSEDAARRMFLEALPESMPKRERLALFRRHALARETLAAQTEEAGPEADLITAAAAQVADQKSLRNQADFTDLLEFLLELVCGPEFTPPFAHVLVDEVQDLSALQLEAVLGLVGGSGAGFFAIGDPDQSIYGFRGAAGDVRERLAARWPQLQVVSLAENYRSGQGILDISGALPPQAPGLKARRDRDWDVELLEAPDARHEASLVAARVARLLGGTSHTLMDAECANLAPGDVAVLVRFRALIGPYKAALEVAGVPCSAPEAEVFWEEPRVAAILRVAERLFGLPAPLDVEKGGTEKGETEEDGAEPTDAAGVVDADLPEFLLLQGPRVLPSALRETPPFDRYFWDGPAFRDLCHAFDAQGGWVGLLDWVRLETDFASIRQTAQKVRILTLHAAKGLEFDAVFLPALEQGILPFSGFGGAPLTPEQLAEERRLFYVGLTRAKSRLCLSFARQRTLYGKTLTQEPSPFLADLPQDLLRRTVLAPKVQTRQTQLNLF